MNDFEYLQAIKSQNETRFRAILDKLPEEAFYLLPEPEPVNDGPVSLAIPPGTLFRIFVAEHIADKTAPETWHDRNPLL